MQQQLADLTVSEDDLPNFKMVTSALYRGGQPSRRGFEQLKELGIKTIINLRDELHLVDREKMLVEDLGMDYVSIPLSPFQHPANRAIAEFLSIASEEVCAPCFVHCQHGQDRTGMIVSIFRMETHGWALDEAYKEALEMGFHPYYTHLHETVLKFARSDGS